MKYKNIIVALLLIMIVILVIYFTSSYEKIYNLIGNIITGLTTGIILVILKNVKKNDIKKSDTFINKYNKLLVLDQNIYNNIYILRMKKDIDIIEIVHLYSDIYSLFSACCKIKNGNVLKISEEYRISSLLSKVEEELKEINIYNKNSDEYYITKNEYMEKYDINMTKYIKPVLELKIAIREDIDNEEINRDKIKNSIF